MNTEELIERLERAGIDPAFNDEVIEALREQQAEIERLKRDLEYVESVLGFRFTTTEEEPK